MVNTLIFQEYLEALNDSSCAKAIADLFLKTMQSLGFQYAVLSSHVDLSCPPEDTILVHHYPVGWYEHFSDNHYGLIDPVFHKAQLATHPFFWDDQAFLGGLGKQQLQILKEGGEFGIKDGFTIPISVPGAISASCSLIPDADGVDPLHYPLAHSLAVFTHGRMLEVQNARFRKAIPVLTFRQRQYLQLAAEGKSEWEMSKILDVSEFAAHAMMQRIRQQLGVTTRTQAVALAVNSRQIHVGH